MSEAQKEMIARMAEARLRRLASDMPNEWRDVIELEAMALSDAIREFPMVNGTLEIQEPK